MSLEERVRERLAELIAVQVGYRPWGAMAADRADLRLMVRTDNYDVNEPTRDDCYSAADAILREFRLQPVVVGKVDAETGEVEVAQEQKRR